MFAVLIIFHSIENAIRFECARECVCVRESVRPEPSNAYVTRSEHRREQSGLFSPNADLGFFFARLSSLTTEPSIEKMVFVLLTDDRVAMAAIRPS